MPEYRPTSYSPSGIGYTPEERRQNIPAFGDYFRRLREATQIIPEEQLRGMSQRVYQTLPTPVRRGMEYLEPAIEEASMAGADMLMPMVGMASKAVKGLMPEKLAKKAKNFFGTTLNPKETGYILQDGTRLDLSGRHYSSGYKKTSQGYKPETGKPDYLRGDRMVDHREIYDVVGESGTEGMLKFQSSTGAVRYMPGTGISVTQLPTRQQIKKVVRDFRQSGDSLLIDIDSPKGDVIASTEFIKPTVDSVMDWLSKYFKKGKI